MAPRLVSRLVLAGGMLAGGLAALMLGRTYEWDMRNYHLYNPHALFTGRLFIDLAPAEMQTFLNPLLHVPSYLAFRYLHPTVWVFISGALQGLQLFLLWRILQACAHPRLPQWTLLILAALGLVGPITLHELGGTQGDTVLSALALWSVLLALDEQAMGGVGGGQRRMLLAGLLLGLATALKLTFAIYAVGLGVALLVCGSGLVRWQQVLAYGRGAALGFVLGGGAWFAHLWIEYQNPFFPFFNEAFQSQWAGKSNFRDLRFMPTSVIEWLTYPVTWLMDPLRVWEIHFRDLRVVALYPLMVAFLLFGWRRARRNAPELLLLGVFLAVSYVLWLSMFSIYRYLAVIELLAPAMILALVLFMGWPRRRLGLLVMLIASSQFFVEFTRSPRVGHLNADQPSTLSSLPAGSLVVLDGVEPIAYTILWLEDDIPAVRIRANFMNADPPEGRMHREALQRVRQHIGPVYLLLSSGGFDAPYSDDYLSGLGLNWNGPASCQPVFLNEMLQNETGIVICPLVRMPLELAQEAR